MPDVITSLEMTSPSQLVPGRPPPAPLDLQEVGPDAAPLVRSLWLRIGEPHGWTERARWSDADWVAELSKAGVRAWVARVGSDAAGLVELEAEGNGHVGILFFGLVPEFVGNGFGGAFLTLATRLAWGLTGPDGVPARRVWLQTSSRDHPHARPNYEARGFRSFRTERR